MRFTGNIQVSGLILLWGKNKMTDPTLSPDARKLYKELRSTIAENGYLESKLSPIEKKIGLLLEEIERNEKYVDTLEMGNPTLGEYTAIVSKTIERNKLLSTRLSVLTTILFCVKDLNDAYKEKEQ